MELLDNFRKDNITEEIQENLTPVYNVTRLASYNGNLYFTANKIYWIYADYEHVNLKSWSIDISEIAAYKKTGLAGYRITLKSGEDLNFSNVFGKMRTRMTEAIEKRM